MVNILGTASYNTKLFYILIKKLLKFIMVFEQVKQGVSELLNAP
jgi:hypothetical protein